MIRLYVMVRPSDRSTLTKNLERGHANMRLITNPISVPVGSSSENNFPCRYTIACLPVQWPLHLSGAGTRTSRTHMHMYTEAPTAGRPAS